MSSNAVDSTLKWTSTALKTSVKFCGCVHPEEGLPTSKHWPVYSDMAKEHYGKGAEQGQASDRRDALLTLVDKRGLVLSDKQRKLITDADDLDQLKGWFDAAITADSADDIFR